MEQFLTRHQPEIKGVLSGFDRLIFHGTLRCLNYTAGMLSYLSWAGVLLKDFGSHVEQTSNILKNRIYEQFEKMNKPNEYLYPGSDDLGERALATAERNRIEEGSIILLRRVEPCMSYDIRKNSDTHKLELIKTKRACLHLYHYLIHPDFGFMHIRIQSWYPFTIQVYVNGREWLARRLDKLGIDYVQQGNCFLHIDDYQAAQNEFDKLAGMDWQQWLSALVPFSNPGHSQMFPEGGMEHYWTVYQSEWATDVNFHKPDYLQQIYPHLTHGAMLNFGSESVMRFLGRKLNGNFKGEVTTHYKGRPEGVCVRHRVDSNSLKMYDKEGQLLRVESTINAPEKFKVFRSVRDGEEPKWVPMRKGIADLKRRSELNQKANERYFDALASLNTDVSVSEVVLPVCKPTMLGKQRIRAMRPWNQDDRELLEAVANGKFIAQGFRNADILGELYPTMRNAKKEHRRRVASRITRKLRMLRAHGIIRKIPRSHRYTLTTKGREMATLLISTQHLTIQQINTIAS